MKAEICAQCFVPYRGPLLHIALVRAGFRAVYNLNVCHQCFEIYRTMAHESAESWHRGQTPDRAIIGQLLLE